MTPSVTKKPYILILLVAFLMSTLIPVLKVYELQGFVPFTTENAPADVNAITQHDEGQGRILLCTTEGFQWVSIAELESGSISTSHSFFDCASCCTMAYDAKDVLPSQNSYFGERRYVKEPWYALVEVNARTQIYAQGVFVRGPPFTV